MSTPSAPRILAFAGSARRDSYNKKVVKIAAAGAREAGVDVTVIDLANYPLPVYDQDLELEHGLPGPVQELKRLMIEHDGFLISSPEHNSSLSAALKNVIDWTSRSAPGEGPLVAFRGKTAALMSASPGALGGLRGLVHVRSILGNIGMIVLPDQIAIAKANEALDEAGQLRDPKQQAGILGLGRTLAEFLKRMKRE